MAACAIAKTNADEFIEVDAAGLARDSKKKARVLYQWLDANYAQGSKSIKTLKDSINDSNAHASLIYATNVFEAGRKQHTVRFFDFEDKFVVQSELWKIGSAAIRLVDLFFGVNLDHHGFVPCDDFDAQFKVLIERDKRLQSEVMASERYQGIMNGAAKNP